MCVCVCCVCVYCVFVACLLVVCVLVVYSLFGCKVVMGCVCCMSARVCVCVLIFFSLSVCNCLLSFFVCHAVLEPYQILLPHRFALHVTLTKFSMKFITT